MKNERKFILTIVVVSILGATAVAAAAQQGYRLGLSRLHHQHLLRYQP